MTDPQEEKQTSWLERLATESWQAEMVISGVAIFGSFQLFEGVNRLADWLYFTMPESLVGVAYFLVFYLFIAAAVLCISFLGHFVIRAIWIASIGLESVYPEGIRRENETYTVHYMDQFFRKFGTLHNFNLELDRVGSAMLAYALMFVMTFSGIGILLSLGLFISYIVAQIFNEDIAFWVLTSLLGVVIFGLFFSAFLNAKQLREREWVRRIQFPLTTFFGNYLFANVFYQPQAYMSFTIRTNLAKNSFTKIMIFMVVGMILVSATLLLNSHIFFLQKGLYLRADSRTDKLYGTNYAAGSEDEKLAFIRPQIPAQTIRNLGEFQLFLPLPEREEGRILLLCSQTEPTGEADEDAARQALYAYYTACYQEQIRITIDSTKVAFVLKKYDHPHQQEPGLLYFFPGLNLTPGEHTLVIEHLAIKEPQLKVDRIPFFYLPNDH
jgi:hypothetical protein